MYACRGANGHVRLSADRFLTVNTAGQSFQIGLDQLSAIQIRRKSIMPPLAAASIVGIFLAVLQVVMMGWVPMSIPWESLALAQQLLLFLLALSLASALLRSMLCDLALSHKNHGSSFTLHFVWTRSARGMVEKVRAIQTIHGE